MAGGIITMPDYPVLGVPTDTKQAGKVVNLKPTEFDLMIEAQGYLMAWERFSLCPCAPVTDKTEQPDPNCELCSGTGGFYFGPPSAQDLTEYTFDAVQQAFLDGTDAMVIRGIITSLAHKPDPVDVATRRNPGTGLLTVRHENKLGYYDKVTLLDAQIALAEVLTADGTNLLPARYLMTGVNKVRTATVEYVADSDYEILDGKIRWYTSSIPAADTRLSVHYLCHPTYKVMEHPHSARVAQKKFKTPNPTTPTGNPNALPVQAAIQYEFL